MNYFPCLYPQGDDGWDLYLLCEPAGSADDLVGVRYAALVRHTFSPASLAAYIGKPVAEVLQVLRNDATADAEIARLVDSAIGLIPPPAADDSGDEVLDAIPDAAPDYEGARSALREKLRSLGLTMTWMDDDMRVSRGTCAAVLRGDYRSAKIEAALCRAAGVDPAAVFPPQPRLQIARRSKYGPTISPSFAHTNPKGPRT